MSQVIFKAQPPNFSPKPRTPNASTLNPNLQWGGEPSGVSQVVVAIFFLANAQSNASTVSERVQCTRATTPERNTANTARRTPPYLLMFSVCRLIHARLHAPTGARRRVEGHEGKVRRHRVLLRCDADPRWLGDRGHRRVSTHARLDAQGAGIVQVATNAACCREDCSGATLCDVTCQSGRDRVTLLGPLVDGLSPSPVWGHLTWTVDGG